MDSARANPVGGNLFDCYVSLARARCGGPGRFVVDSKGNIVPQMSLLKKGVGLATLSMLATGAFLGGQVATAQPAEAACSVTLYDWKAYNSTCSSARHVVIANGKYIYASWAKKGAYSTQTACWAGTTKRGYESKD